MMLGPDVYVEFHCREHAYMVTRVMATRFLFEGLRLAARHTTTKKTNHQPPDTERPTCQSGLYYS